MLPLYRAAATRKGIVKKISDLTMRENQSTGKLRRRTPEELLRECQTEEEAAARTGHLKVMLGYASGVGKTFRLLDEARRRRARGQDVVVGAIQPEVPPEAKSLLSKLEIIPLKRFDGGTAIDVDAILRRHPTVCFIDGLAYNNPPAARNPTRWQDVHDLLRAGIKVVGSTNVQYIAELQDQIEAITGERKTETAPLSFLKNASEFEIVDAPPEEPVERSPEEQIEARKRDQRLSKLRELALVFAADVVDYQLNEYLECHGIHQHFGTHERILVCVTPHANLQQMLEEAQIVADKFHGELIVAYVKQPKLSAEDQSALDARLAIASAAGAHIEILEGDEPADAILEFARSRGVTQLFVGNKRRTGLSRLRASPLEKLIWQGHGMDVRVFPQ
jgi:two-component system sensor histidine kinase KdpD